MDVRPQPLEESPIVRLVSMESRRDINIFQGDTVGYWCSMCQMADETLDQIVHAKECDLAGKHGRTKYGADLDPMDGQARGELNPKTTFTVLVWGESDRSMGIHNGETLAFRCDECANLDEHIFEILHDEVCELARQ